MVPIILVGGGGHCKACIDVIRAERRYRVIGIVDDHLEWGASVLGIPVVGTDADIPRLAADGAHFLVTVGQIKSPESRIRLYQKIKGSQGRLPAIVSPLAYVSADAHIGEGTIIMHYSIVNADAYVGANCIVNTGALVEHDAIVADHCHLATGSIINGGARVGEGSFVGSNAVTRQGAVITPGSVVPAGSYFPPRKAQ